jgi:hypothetical protein
MNKQIVVIGKRWFSENTYHTVAVYVDGDLLEVSPITYGYGEHYNDTAKEILFKHGIYERVNTPIALWNLVKTDNGDKLISTVSDVARKKDL